MHKNTVWLAFLSCVMLVVLGYTGVALVKTYNYYKLNESIPAEFDKWLVIPLSDEKYVYEAHYHFKTQNGD